MHQSPSHTRQRLETRKVAQFQFIFSRVVYILVAFSFLRADSAERITSIRMQVVKTTAESERERERIYERDDYLAGKEENAAAWSVAGRHRSRLNLDARPQHRFASYNKGRDEGKRGRGGTRAPVKNTTTNSRYLSLNPLKPLNSRHINVKYLRSTNTGGCAPGDWPRRRHR